MHSNNTGRYIQGVGSTRATGMAKLKVSTSVTNPNTYPQCDNFSTPTLPLNLGTWGRWWCDPMVENKRVLAKFDRVGGLGFGLALA